MRTMIGKRIGTAPIAVVAVLALAAFISAGLWLLPTGQTAEADGHTCTVDTETRGFTLCTTAGDSVTLEFENDGAAASIYTYTSSGTGITGASVTFSNAPTAYGKTVTAAAVGTTFDGSLLSLPAESSNPNTGATTPGSATHTVARTRANDDGMAFVIFSNTSLVSANESPVVLNSVESMAIIVFQGSVDADESTVEAGAIAGGKSTVTVHLKDANGNPLFGWIDVAVDGGEDVLFEGSGLKTIRLRADAPTNLGDADSGKETATVTGLPTSGAVRNTVSATLGGVTVEGNIERSGPAATVEAAAYACTPGDTWDHDNDASTAEVVETGACGEEIRTYDDDDAAPLKDVGVLTAGDAFFYNAISKDALGNDATGSADGEAGGADAAAKAAVNDAFSRLDPLQTITVKQGAPSGTHVITVSNGDASYDLSITVAGPADSISVACDPTAIPASTGLTDCTVTVVDANGNVPHNVEGEHATVAVRSTDASIIGVNNLNAAPLGADGTADFRILLREDAPSGDITVNVVSTIGGKSLTAATTVSYTGTVAPVTDNRAPTRRGSIDDVTMTIGDAAMSVDVLNNFSDADNDALTYSAFSNNNGVATAAADGVSGAITVTAVGVGTATITVRATDGMSGPATQTFMVTVEQPSDGSVGAPSDLAAASGDGMLTLSWTAGANSDRHWVAAIKQSDREAGDYSNLIWEAADSNTGHVLDGLDNGSEYAFTVTAGQDHANGSTTWSAWASIATGTPSASGGSDDPPQPSF